MGADRPRRDERHLGQQGAHHPGIGGAVLVAAAERQPSEHPNGGVRVGGAHAARGGEAHRGGGVLETTRKEGEEVMSIVRG